MERDCKEKLKPPVQKESLFTKNCGIRCFAQGNPRRGPDGAVPLCPRFARTSPPHCGGVFPTVKQSTGLFDLPSCAFHCQAFRPLRRATKGSALGSCQPFEKGWTESFDDYPTSFREDPFFMRRREKALKEFDQNVVDFNLTIKYNKKKTGARVRSGKGR